jgi:hypothetical protein
MYKHNLLKESKFEARIEQDYYPSLQECLTTITSQCSNNSEEVTNTKNLAEGQSVQYEPYKELQHDLTRHCVDMKSYWEQFGFFDLDTNMNVLSQLMMQHIQLRKTDDDRYDDNTVVTDDDRV